MSKQSWCQGCGRQLRAAFAVVRWAVGCRAGNKLDVRSAQQLRARLSPPRLGAQCVVAPESTGPWLATLSGTGHDDKRRRVEW